MSKKILVVDDDDDIRELVTIYLKTENYYVNNAKDGEEALKRVEEMEYDMVILDVMMPKKDGIETLMELRKRHAMPVIFLTAKGSEIDLIQGLALGADDYIAKPFSSMELLARVKAQLRRYTVLNNVNKHNIVIGELEMDTQLYRVTVAGREIKLTPTEYRILELFCHNRGVVFTVEQIYEHLWKNKYVVGDTSIMVHITRIRKKIEKDPKNPEYIKTVWGVGYKL